MFALGGALYATTWEPTKIKDPISGKEVDSFEISSFGSYIYGWPSKYDGVYWPLIADECITFSPISGFIAFTRDFEELTPDEMKKIREFLVKNYDSSKPPKTHEERLNWLARVSEARGMSEDFWMAYYCLRSFLSRRDPDAAKPWRQDALKRISKHLETAKPSFSTAQWHLVAAFNHKLLGDEAKSKEAIAKARQVDFRAINPEKSAGMEVRINELASEIESGEYKSEYLPPIGGAK